MKSIDEKHQNKRLKNVTRFELGQNINTPTAELLLSLSEVINFRMLEPVNKCKSDEVVLLQKGISA